MRWSTAFHLPLFLANQIVFFNSIHWPGINRLPAGFILTLTRAWHVLPLKITFQLASLSPISIVSTCPLLLPGNVL